MHLLSRQSKPHLLFITGSGWGSAPGRGCGLSGLRELGAGVTVTAAGCDEDGVPAGFHWGRGKPAASEKAEMKS